MIQASFGSNYSEVLPEDHEILKNINRQLKRIFLFFGGDFLLCIFCAIVDSIFYLHGFIPKMFLEFFFIILIAIEVTVLLLLKRKTFCIIAGFSYLIGGGAGWLTKIIYICYLIFGKKVKESFDERYSKQYWSFIVFIVQIGVIGVRLYTCYMIKNIYRSLGYYESYRREKEHAEFLEKLGNKIDEDKNKEGDNKDGNNNDGICEIKFDEDEENPEEYNENQI
jgi:hypothetical protein